MSGIALTTIDVPVELVKKSCGLAIDHGSATFKAAYVSKQNAEEAAKKTSGTTPITLLMIDGTRFVEGLEHLSKQAIINKDLTQEIYTTGLGCTLNGKEISDKFGVKLNNLAEYDANIRALLYLTNNLPRAQLFHDPDQSRTPKPYILVDLVKSLLEDPSTGLKGVNMGVLENPKSVIETRDRGSTLPLVKAEKDYFPCLFVLTGSGVDYIQVNADGTFTLLDGSGRGGMSFLGLGSLLTGAQSFEQLVKLAEAGNPKNVDIYSDAFDQDGGATADDSMYSKTLAGQASPIYAFGKCVGAKLGDLKKEDVARALLDLFVADIIQTTMTVSSAGGLRRACLGGNFITSKLVRDLMIEQMDRRNLYYSITGKPTIGIDFLQSSAHIGAIGALVSHYEKHSTKL